MSERIGVIGAGRLGSCLAVALERAGLPVSMVASARMEDAVWLSGWLAGAGAARVEDVAQGCELVFLCVPDGSVARLAQTIGWRAGQSVVHCSGALGLEVLDVVGHAGGLRGCLHPLQSFPERLGEPTRFAGIYCGIEADGALVERLEGCCAALGARSLRLAGIDRASYHAAAVFASNYVVALHAAAAKAFGHAGLAPEVAQAALAPLTLGASEQIARLPLEQALTGPLLRGDVATLAAHMSALQALPDVRALYVRLARGLLELPLALDPDQRAQITALLERSEAALES